MNRGPGTGFGALGVAVLALLAACTGGDDGSDGQPSTTSATTASTSEGPAIPLPPGADLAVGACFEAPTPAPGAPLGAFEITMIDCLQPHTYEAYARVDHPAEPTQPYPGGDLVFGFATDQCLEQFGDYVGRDYEDSTLDLVPLELGEAAWEAGARTIVCALFAADLEPLIGSMRGSGA